MRRRTLIKAAGGMALVSGAALAGPASTVGKRRLKMVTSWPRDFPGLGTSANRIARRIGVATNGEISVSVHAAGELVGAFETLDAVASGKADLYHSADYYQAAKSPAYNFFTAVPFGMTADEMAGWLQYGGGQSLWDELSAGFNIKPLLCTSTGTQMGGWFNREIRSLDDFDGLKIRMPGLGGEVLKHFGATPVNVPGGEIYERLRSGELDAAEWVGPWNDLAAGLHEVADHYYYPAFHEPAGLLALGINRDVWDSFSEFQKAAIGEAATAEYTRSLAEFNVRNAGALGVLRDEHGVIPKRWSDEILAAIGEISGELLAKIGAADDLTARVFDSFMAARRQAMSWAAVSEEAFTRARRLDFSY